MKGGVLIHRSVTAQQADMPQQAIGNHRETKKLMRAWEVETERLVDLEAPHQT